LAVCSLIVTFAAPDQVSIELKTRGPNGGQIPHHEQPVCGTV
jgi:hypothetical protein